MCKFLNFTLASIVLDFFRTNIISQFNIQSFYISDAINLRWSTSQCVCFFKGEILKKVNEREEKKK